MPLRILLLILCPLIWVGCVDIPDEPVIPSWDVQLSVSLTNTSHSISELVSDIASLPPEVLDTLDLTNVTLTFQRAVAIGGSEPNAIIDSTFTEEFLTNVWQARIFAEVENATPVHLNVAVELLDNNSVPLIVLPGNGGTVNLEGAPLDEEGKVGPSTTETTFLDLNDPDISNLESIESLRYLIDINFPEGVSPAHVLAADSMSIRTWGTLWTTVEPD